MEGIPKEVDLPEQESNMNPSKFFRLPVMTSCAAMGLFVATAVHAQAPSGPITAAPATAADGANKVTPPPPLPPPRTTILGAWKLNKDDSDDPRDSERESQDSGGYGRRGGGGGSWPGNGGGGGGYGGRRPGGMNDEQREQMRELTTPPRSMTISMTGAEVDLLDDHDRKLAFMTDGRKLQKSKDAGYTEIAAKFEGTKLISDEKDPHGNKMSRTFELSEDGRQLIEMLHMTVGRKNTPRVIRYVYDIPPLPAPRQ
jgi:hypothetical protein